MMVVRNMVQAITINSWEDYNPLALPGASLIKSDSQTWKINCSADFGLDFGDLTMASQTTVGEWVNGLAPVPSANTTANTSK